MEKSFTAGRLIRDSLRHHRRIHIAVALGTAAATAVLTGALLVGDSMRGSLFATAMSRLGPVDEVLVSDKLFRSELSKEIGDPQERACGEHYSAVEPAILLQGNVTNPANKSRASQVTLIGLALNDAVASQAPNPQSHLEQANNEVDLNQPLADELGVKVGDDIIVRLPPSQEVPEESPLGRKTDTALSSSRLKVRSIVPAVGFGAFSLRPNQQVTKNAYLTIAALQKILDKPNRINALFAYHRRGSGQAADPRDLRSLWPANAG